MLLDAFTQPTWDETTRPGTFESNCCNELTEVIDAPLCACDAHDLTVYTSNPLNHLYGAKVNYIVALVRRQKGLPDQGHLNQTVAMN